MPAALGVRLRLDAMRISLPPPFRDAATRAFQASPIVLWAPKPSSLPVAWYRSGVAS